MSLDTRGVQIPNGSKNPDDEQLYELVDGIKHNTPIIYKKDKCARIRRFRPIKV